MLDGLRVLVLEDEVLIASDLVEIISEGGGAVVGPSSTIRQARQLLKHEPVDGVILDVILEDGDLTPVPSGSAVLQPSLLSTLLTFRSRSLAVKGLPRKFTPSSSRPWWMMALRV